MVIFDVVGQQLISESCHRWHSFLVEWTPIVHLSDYSITSKSLNDYKSCPQPTYSPPVPRFNALGSLHCPSEQIALQQSCHLLKRSFIFAQEFPTTQNLICYLMARNYCRNQTKPKNCSHRFLSYVSGVPAMVS